MRTSIAKSAMIIMMIIKEKIMKHATPAAIRQEVAPYALRQGLTLFIRKKSAAYIKARILETYEDAYCESIGDAKGKSILSICSTKTHRSFLDIIVR